VCTTFGMLDNGAALMESAMVGSGVFEGSVTGIVVNEIVLWQSRLAHRLFWAPQCVCGSWL